MWGSPHTTGTQHTYIHTHLVCLSQPGAGIHRRQSQRGKNSKQRGLGDRSLYFRISLQKMIYSNAMFLITNVEHGVCTASHRRGLYLIPCKVGDRSSLVFLPQDLSIFCGVL